MHETRKSNIGKARYAGILYLAVAIIGGFAIMYIPNSITVAGDSAATANNIIEAGWVFRLAIVSSLIYAVLNIFLALAFSRLFKDVSARYVKLLLIMVLVTVPIIFLNTLNLFAAQLLVSGTPYLNAFNTEQLHALMMMSLDLNELGIAVVEIFWGLWLFPLGYLVFKSGFMPKIIGIFLMIGCFSYLIISAIAIFWPAYLEATQGIILLPLAVGEFSTIFWLVFMAGRMFPNNNP
jgi:hypothetical protein